jgi:hypothetical protein
MNYEKMLFQEALNKTTNFASLYFYFHTIYKKITTNLGFLFKTVIILLCL